MLRAGGVTRDEAGIRSRGDLGPESGSPSPRSRDPGGNSRERVGWRGRVTGSLSGGSGCGSVPGAGGRAASASRLGPAGGSGEVGGPCRAGLRQAGDKWTSGEGGWREDPRVWATCTHTRPHTWGHFHTRALTPQPQETERKFRRFLANKVVPAHEVSAEGEGGGGGGVGGVGGAPPHGLLPSPAVHMLWVPGGSSGPAQLRDPGCHCPHTPSGSQAGAPVLHSSGT